MGPAIQGALLEQCQGQPLQASIDCPYDRNGARPIAAKQNSQPNSEHESACKNDDQEEDHGRYQLIAKDVLIKPDPKVVKIERTVYPASMNILSKTFDY